MNNPEKKPQQKIRDETVEFCRLLNLYLMKKYSYRKEHAWLIGQNTIQIEENRVYLYLHFKPRVSGLLHLKPIIIAGIKFKRSRKGEGAEFLKLLVRLAPQIGIDSVAIECPHSEAIQSFGKKFGFERISHDYLVATIWTLEAILRD